MRSDGEPFGGGPAVSGVNDLLPGGTVHDGDPSSRLLALVAPSGTHALEAGAHYYCATPAGRATWSGIKSLDR